MYSSVSERKRVRRCDDNKWCIPERDQVKKIVVIYII